MAYASSLTDTQLRAAAVPVSGTITSNVGAGTRPVSGTFWQATQPVSIASMPSTPVTGTFFQATQPVSGTITANAGTGTFAISAASLPLPAGAATSAKQPALGTAGAAATDVITVQGIASGTAQPVSLTSTTITGSVAVTGTFFQATQPISGTVTANAGTGTFAVSGPLTDTQLRAAVVPVSLASTTVTGSVAVTGAFFQATQPVSGTFFQATQPISLAAALPTGANVIGAVTQSGTWNIGAITTLPALPTGANVIGALTANQSVNVAQMGGVATTMGSGVTGTGVQRVVLATDVGLPAGTNTLGKVDIGSAPVLTKGTQGLGFSTQDLKDAGRNQTNFFMAVPILTTAAEVMQSMTGYKSGAAVAATATPAVVTTGKNYRINKIVLTYYNVAALGSARVNLRANTAGVAVVGSPLAMTWQVGISGDGASTAGHVSTYDFSFPDGLEFAAATGIAFGVVGQGVVPTTATAVGYILIQCFGFEY